MSSCNNSKNNKSDSNCDNSNSSSNQSNDIDNICSNNIDSKPISLKRFILQNFWCFKWHSLIHIATLITYIVMLTYTPNMIRYIADGSKDLHTMLLHVIGMTLSIAVSFRIYHYVVWVMLLPKLKKQLSNTGFSAMIGHEHAYYVNNTVGDLGKRRMDVTNEIPQFYMCLVDGMLVSLSLIIGSLINISSLPIKYVSLVGAWCLSFILLSLMFAKPVSKKSEQVAKQESELNGIASDVCQNMLTVRFFNGYAYEQNRFQKYVEKYRKMEVSLELYYYVIFTFYSFGFAAAIYYSMIWFKTDFALNIVKRGDIASFYHLMFIMSSRLWQVTDHIQKLITQLGKIKNAYKLFIDSIDNSILQKISSGISSINSTNTKLETKDVGHIQFKHVSFGYKPTKQLFNDFNIEIQAGEKIGIIGHSGGGKTTFTNLLLGLFDNYTGHILINGKNVREMSREELYSQISVITQQSMLFNRTIYENLTYGKQHIDENGNVHSATLEEVIHAADMAQAHGFITELEQGYDTLIAEHGASLSGGQKQRLAIARTILKSTPIVVFDEFTSQLDLLNESIICDNLMKVMKDKTLIIIAHRLSTIKHMDRILVFDHGNVIAQGTHAELQETCEIYRNLKKHGHFE